MKNLFAAALILGWSPGAWAQADQRRSAQVAPKGETGRRAAPVRRATGKIPAVRIAALSKIQCPAADFTFEPAGDMVDVVDRDYSNMVVKLVGEVRSSPSAYVISWDRPLSTAMGVEITQYRYMIDRETGKASAYSIGQLPGMPPYRTTWEAQCTIAR